MFSKSGVSPRLAMLARAAALICIFTLFTVGSLPAAGLAFPGALHWAAHLATYALIAFCAGLGWWRHSAPLLVALVALMGLLHETTEIITHSHAFEGQDVLINALGALVGVALQRGFSKPAG
jgi:hypothetical protein